MYSSRTPDSSSCLVKIVLLFTEHKQCENLRIHNSAQVLFKPLTKQTVYSKAITMNLPSFYLCVNCPYYSLKCLEHTYEPQNHVYTGALSPRGPLVGLPDLTCLSHFLNFQDFFFSMTIILLIINATIIIKITIKIIHNDNTYHNIYS